MLQVKLGKVTVVTTSGPPDWREVYQADDAGLTYKLLEAEGLAINCFQLDSSQLSSSRQLGKCLLNGVSGRVMMSKLRKSSGKAVANFLKAEYTLTLELTGSTLPMVQAGLGLILDYNDATDSWTVSHSGKPLKLSLDHVIQNEELLEITAWANTLYLSFACMQPELEFRLEAARRSQAMEHARNLELRGANEALKELCSQLEAQLGAAKARVAKTAEYETQRAAARAKDVAAVRAKLASLLPRSNTAEVAAAAEVDRLLAAIAGQEAEWSEAVGRSECGGDASQDAGKKAYKFGDLTRGALRSFGGMVSGGRPSSAARSSGSAPSGGAQPEPATCGGLVIRKRSWLAEQQVRDCSANADHLSTSALWCAIKLEGEPQLHKLQLGPLQQIETRVPAPAPLCSPSADGTPRRIELLALWLDLGANYQLNQQVHGYDFTIALQSISVSPLTLAPSPRLSAMRAPLAPMLLTAWRGC